MIDFLDDETIGAKEKVGYCLEAAARWATPDNDQPEKLRRKTHTYWLRKAAFWMIAATSRA